MKTAKYTERNLSDLDSEIEAQRLAAKKMIESLSEDEKFKLDCFLDQTFIPNVNSQAIGFDKSFFRKMACIRELGMDRKITATTVLMSE